jgi:hypothetical protein
MAFTPDPDRVQTELGDMGYQIFDPRPDGEESRSATWSAQILDQNGQIIHVRTGEMIPNMLPEEIQTMIALLEAWRARAAAGLIPT